MGSLCTIDRLLVCCCVACSCTSSGCRARTSELPDFELLPLNVSLHPPLVHIHEMDEQAYSNLVDLKPNTSIYLPQCCLDPHSLVTVIFRYYSSLFSGFPCHLLTPFATATSACFRILHSLAHFSIFISPHSYLSDQLCLSHIFRTLLRLLFTEFSLPLYMYELDQVF